MVTAQRIIAENLFGRPWRRRTRACRARRRMLGAAMWRVLAVGLTLAGLCSVAQARHLRDRDDDSGAKPAGFAAGIDAMIGTCDRQAADLKKLPVDFVSQTIQLSPEQRDALEQIRSAAARAAASLAEACPKTIPGQLSGKLEQLDNVLRLVADSLQNLRRPLAAFYSSLDDEQKAQLVVAGLSDKRTTEPDSKSSRKDRALEANASAAHKSMCSDWSARLRSWPVRQIDAALTLSDMQRAALYELSAAIYRSAGDLVEACPVESRVTPPSRMNAQEDELRALRQDIRAIRPFAAAFESALNDTQKRRLEAAVEASTASPTH